MKLSFFALFFTAIFTAFSYGVETVKIQTTAVCGMCKDRIESVLGSVEGVESARLDLTTKIVKIKYDDTKQSEASLRALITKIGYGADDLTADPAAFEALPGCCKSEAACKANKEAKAELKAETTAAPEAEATAAPKKACCKGAKKACSGKGKS